MSDKEEDFTACASRAELDALTKDRLIEIVMKQERDCTRLTRQQVSWTYLRVSLRFLVDFYAGRPPCETGNMRALLSELQGLLDATAIGLPPDPP